MSFMVQREPSDDTLYPVDIPGHCKKRGLGSSLTLYFTARQLTQLRANAAKAILKSQKHHLEKK